MCDFRDLNLWHKISPEIENIVKTTDVELAF